MRHRSELAASLLGCALVSVALVIIWMSRLTIPRELYVSELGAVGMPTASWFELSLVLVAVGGAAIAWAGRRARSTARLLRAWTPAVSLWIACALFLVASQVTCTAGCPVPLGDTFVLQDFVHTLAAVLAFAAACWAMLQSSFARHHRVLAVFSRVAAVAVAVIAGSGGILSILRFQQGFGSRLEFVATTLAIAWLVVFGAVFAVRSARAAKLTPHEQQ